MFVGQARDLVRMDMVGLEMMRMRVEVEIDEEGKEGVLLRTLGQDGYVEHDQQEEER